MMPIGIKNEVNFIKKYRPYIDGNEQELFDCCAKATPSVKEDLRYRYINKKEIYRSFLFDEDDFLKFYERLLRACNDEIPTIAKNSVGWLMMFISFGVLTAEYEEKIDFIEQELGDIIQNNHIKRLRNRLWPEDILLMKQDLKIAANFYGLEFTDQLLEDDEFDFTEIPVASEQEQMLSPQADQKFRFAFWKIKEDDNKNFAKFRRRAAIMHFGMALTGIVLTWFSILELFSSGNSETGLDTYSILSIVIPLIFLLSALLNIVAGIQSWSSKLYKYEGLISNWAIRLFILSIAPLLIFGLIKSIVF